MINYSIWRKRYYLWFKNSSLYFGVGIVTISIILANYLNRKEVVHLSLVEYTVYFFTGWFLWTFMEYIIHRFLFHFSSGNKGLRFIQFLLHGVHHSYPDDTLIIPSFFRVVILLKSFIAFSYLSGIYFAPVFSGYLWGMLAYLIVHTAIHREVFKKILRKQYRNHYWHHYRNQHSAYGVTLVLWDWVFGTLPE